MRLNKSQLKTTKIMSVSAVVIACSYGGYLFQTNYRTPISENEFKVPTPVSGAIPKIESPVVAPSLRIVAGPPVAAPEKTVRAAKQASLTEVEEKLESTDSATDALIVGSEDEKIDSQLDSKVVQQVEALPDDTPDNSTESWLKRLGITRKQYDMIKRRQARLAKEVREADKRGAMGSKKLLVTEHEEWMREYLGPISYDKFREFAAQGQFDSSRN